MSRRFTEFRNRWGREAVIALAMVGASSFYACSKYDTKPSEGFSGPVQTIVFEKCVSCHSGGVAEGSFGVVDNPNAMIEGLYITPGNAEESLFYQKVAGTAAEGSRMPFGGPFLTESQLQSVRDWINALPIPPEKFNVSATGSHVTISPSDVQIVLEGSTLAFTVTAETDYSLSQVVGGTCPAGTWQDNVYTTGKIVGNCAVEFTAKGIYSVTATGSTDITISPAEVQRVVEGQTQAYTVTATAPYEVSTAVSGDCPAGTWAANVYTTGAIVGACSLGFVLKGQLTVTIAGTQLTLAPNTPQTVNEGSTLAITATADTGYSVPATVTGDCPAGTWNADVYTTGVLTQNCSVNLAAVGNFTITSTLGANMVSVNGGTSSKAGPAGIALAVVASPGYGIDRTVGGSCPSGTWSNNTYTLSTVTADCTLTFTGANPCPSVLTTTVSFATDIRPLLEVPLTGNTRNCIFCHKSAAASGNYKMLDPADLTKANYALVVATSGNGNNVASHVKPVDPLNSWLYTKLTTSPPSGNRMPRVGTGVVNYMSLDQQNLVCNWIAQGAFNN